MSRISEHSFNPEIRHINREVGLTLNSYIVFYSIVIKHPVTGALYEYAIAVWMHELDCRP